MRRSNLFQTVVTAVALLAGCQSQVPQSLLHDEEVVPTTPDITVAFAGDHTVADGKIRFQLTFKNIGLAMAAETAVGTKAFLIPRGDYKQKLAGQGLVLETITTPIMLGAGEEVTVDVEKMLPNVAAGSYFLGATTNTRASAGATEDDFMLQEIAFVAESREAQLNNATAKLLDLGELENAVAAVEGRGKYDLYHEIQNAAISLDGGTAGHSSRNILRVMEGEDAVPEYELWDHTISARFLFINLVDGSMSIGAYTSSDVDKVWYAISWNPELDQASRNIHVDYYHNAPSVTHLSEGEYLLGVLMNVNDKFTLDSYPENNLDLTYMNMEAQSLINMQEEVWLSVNSGQTQQAISANIGDRADQHEWSFEIENKPEWLTATGTTSDWQYGINISADATRVPVGIHTYVLKLRAQGQDQTLVSETKIIVYKNEGPAMVFEGVENEGQISADHPNAEIVEIDGVRIFNFHFDVVNAGTQPLVYSLNSQGSPMTLNVPENRILQAGERQTISFSLPLVGVPIPRDGGSGRTQYVSFNAFSNAGNQSFYMYLNLGTDSDEGEDDGEEDDIDLGDGDDIVIQPVVPVGN